MKKDTLQTLAKTRLQEVVRELDQRLDAALKSKDFTSAFELRAMIYLAKRALYEKIISERQEAIEKAETQQAEIKTALEPLMAPYRDLQKQIGALQSSLDRLEQIKTHARSAVRFYENAKAGLEDEKPPIEGSFAVNSLVVTLNRDELVEKILALAAEG